MCNKQYMVSSDYEPEGGENRGRKKVGQLDELQPHYTCASIPSLSLILIMTGCF